MRFRIGSAAKGAVGLVAIALVFGVAGLVYGYNSYMNAFNTQYGTSNTVLNTCGICHVDPGGGGTRTGYGEDYRTHSYSFTAIETLDSDGDGFTNIVEINARTNPGDASVHPAPADTTAPTVTGFAIPATSTSLTVSIATFTATDAVGVTGYLVTETSTKPGSGAAGWAASKPTSYTFATAGAKTLYAWAKDAAGNVSNSLSANVTITLPDTAAPTISSFSIPTTATSLTVSVTALTATDNVGVTGYFVSENTATPVANATGWTASKPTNYTFSSAGARTLYAWAKDAAGNISARASAGVTITLPDTTDPTVTNFVMASSSASLTVPISSLTAADNVGVTGYFLSESATDPTAGAAGWLVTAPTAYTFSSGGSKTLYAWAKDAAGNVSTSATATVTITLADTVAPTVTNFAMPASSTSLSVPITAFTASDDVGVAGYKLTETAAAPLASASGWAATAPTGYNFVSAGSKTLYAWAKDAAGNVSASLSTTVTITLSDGMPPVISSFTVAPTSSSLTVQVTSFTATDNVGVTGYLLSESSTTPASTASGWSVSAPPSYTFASDGIKTLYAWAKDAAGNVSAGMSASVTVVPVTAPPPSPSVSVSPTGLNFGEVEVSRSKTLTVKITNPGNTKVTVTRLSMDNDEFTTRKGKAVTIAPKRSVSVRVTFSPDKAGQASGTLSVFVDDQKSPSAMASLRGSGQTDEGEADFRDRRHERHE